jgi:hypothetical protein
MLMSSTNLAIRELDEPPKTISSTYTCTIRISLPCLRRKRSDRPSPSQSLAQTGTPTTYRTKSRSLLQPIQRLSQLVHPVGVLLLSNPGGCLTYTSSSNTPFRKALFTSIWCNLNPLATKRLERS